MKKSDNHETDNGEDLKKKLEAIIEHSLAENKALRKILRGLEKNKNNINYKKDSISKNKRK